MDKKTRKAIDHFQAYSPSGFNVDDMEYLEHLITIAEKYEENLKKLEEELCSIEERLQDKADKYDKVVERLEQLEEVVDKVLKKPRPNIEDIADFYVNCAKEISKAIKSKLIGEGE